MISRCCIPSANVVCSLMLHILVRNCPGLGSVIFGSTGGSLLDSYILQQRTSIQFLSSRFHIWKVSSIMLARYTDGLVGRMECDLVDGFYAEITFFLRIGKFWDNQSPFILVEDAAAANFVKITRAVYHTKHANLPV